MTTTARGLIAMTAGVVCLAAVGAAYGFQEAPMLAQRVARGELPPVAARLPERPVVVEPVERVGVYGGTWRRLMVNQWDLGLTSRLGYEPIVRWDSSGKRVAPGFAESWRVADGGRRYVFKLRRGMRWSDGRPITSEDVLFWFDDMTSNKELAPAFPAWLKAGGEPARVSAPDAHTVEFRFAEPYGIFLEVLCFRGHVLAPKHYLKQFHPRYTDRAAIERKAKLVGLDFWYQLFRRVSNLCDNPELPSWKAFVLKTQPPSPRLIAERNPYYWKVDPAGNQLPYIDRIAFTEVQNNEILSLKAQAGEVDFQARRIDATNLPLFIANRASGGYQVRRDPNPGSVVLYVNQYSKDARARPILQDRRFRIALSLAINRKELIFLLHSNMARPSRGIASKHDPYFTPDLESRYLDFDPSRAERLLDEIGLKRRGKGLRRLPDGSPFKQILYVHPSESGTSADLWQLVVEYFREVGLDFVAKLDSGALSGMRMRNGNSDFWGYATCGMHWVVDPIWYVPWRSSSAFAPLYGRYVASGGKDKLGVKPSPEMQRLLDTYRELYRVVDDDARKLELGRRILRQWSEECYTIGICREDLLTIVSNRFHNVPAHIIHDYRVMTPGYIGIEQFYMDAAPADAGGPGQ